MGRGGNARRRGRLVALRRRRALCADASREPRADAARDRLDDRRVAAARPRDRAGTGAPVPGWHVWLAVAALGIGGMAVGQYVYYVMLEHHGSTKTALVTYLLPGMALVLGIVFLDEPLTIAAVAGLALVLLGVALGSGMLRPSRR